MIVVHVTHEAVEKIGGIGAVIEGLMCTESYAARVSRTVLLGPLLNTDGPATQRLGQGGRVIYSSLDGICESPWREKFQPIERTYDVGIIYGTRKVDDALNSASVEAEVLLVDVFHVNRDRLNLFKADLYKKFAVPSDQFEGIWEYEQYVRLAEPGLEALKAIGCDDDGGPMVILAHEYMGIPTALKAVLRNLPDTCTVFYAHEVAPVRSIVEKMPGHDTMFFNVLSQAAEQGQTLEELFPAVCDNFKHPLVKAARYCDAVFAVGDSIVSELRFVDRYFRRMDLDLVYNGIPAEKISLEAKLTARSRMHQYASNLFGIESTWVFTHVARPVLSKGIWRDLGVLHEMEPLLAERGETAVYFMLGTLAGQRRPKDVRQMERVYGWPVNHEESYPDLCGGEEGLGAMFANFNREHEAVRVVFINQWGWNRDACGLRVPEEMTFADIRCGTDLEFGLSVYEPFGISQLEPLCFGALCAVSSVCGCMGFVRKAAGDDSCDDNVIEADFVTLSKKMQVEELKGMTIPQREKIESREARRLAGLICRKLPRDEQAIARRIQSGHDLAARMSWEHVMRAYFLPSLENAIAR